MLNTSNDHISYFKKSVLYYPQKLKLTLKDL